MEVLYNVKLLYPTDIPVSPGVINVEIYKPQQGKLPIYIKSLDENDPKRFIQNIASIIQEELLNRINIDIVTQTQLYVIDENSKYKIIFNNSLKDFTIEKE
ncbi:hypothetical protein B0S90_1942 [Caldicellulosiruptor bescii]|jgi:hypothetical protein|uniref:Uncharacterized protein n=2 Tax=Caldicellulosiruptor bescii TaxID=31899 RepID=B9MK82_CALBD|nr:hypothetical protein [Caldicellulosiruptor bescii]ACM60740.1 conserved hypothetical protein [Caldicellulosiruptor bescii DSM 6725]PBC89445.1 hypothetical protein B0S87_2545 [Caldicellulosiruptor bescii]PBC91070.1 hypothetical protein B0S89_1443 [Caldicellulosiruptor bescii]PBD03516.1 hypothetical protein B0S85_1123 [Caldicellulosiruptor bescii]PBD06869.1 hypothetical protein B0S90_1942 [Caldicellulosiruptor bescii]